MSAPPALRRHVPNPLSECERSFKQTRNICCVPTVSGTRCDFYVVGSIWNPKLGVSGVPASNEKPRLIYGKSLQGVASARASTDLDSGSSGGPTGTRCGAPFTSQDKVIVRESWRPSGTRRSDTTPIGKKIDKCHCAHHYSLNGVPLSPYGTRSGQAFRIFMMR